MGDATDHVHRKHTAACKLHEYPCSAGAMTWLIQDKYVSVGSCSENNSTIPGPAGSKT